eukprot:659016-Prorocentrum_minimum.AAC.2
MRTSSIRSQKSSLARLPTLSARAAVTLAATSDLSMALSPPVREPLDPMADMAEHPTDDRFPPAELSLIHI